VDRSPWLVRYSFSNRTRFSGPSWRENDENPATSLNRTVMSRRAPPSASNDGSLFSASITLGARYSPNAPSSHLL
jgi:hypothetical protein